MGITQRFSLSVPQSFTSCRAKAAKLQLFLVRQNRVIGTEGDFHNAKEDSSSLRRVNADETGSGTIDLICPKVYTGIMRYWRLDISFLPLASLRLGTSWFFSPPL